MRTALSSLLFTASLSAAPIPLSNVSIEGDFGDFTYGASSQELAPNLEVITITLSSEKPAQPPKFSVKWNHPSIDVDAFWHTRSRNTRGNYYNNSLTSRISSGAPVLSYYNKNDENRFTFAVSDALNQAKLSAYLREEDAKFYCQVDLFTQRTKAVTDYSVDILIDRREARFDKTLQDVSTWWEKNYAPASVPEVARQPMYSTWYNFHQSLDSALLLEELKIAKKIGFDAVIIDDGWQTNDSARGYKYTGDWKPERLKNMPELVEQIHAEGVKVLLWYSLPFVGTGAENYKRFEGKYLRTFGNSKDTYVLDPRYPECREFIIGTYEKALTDWKLDGFKLDFIGWFAAQGSTKLTAEDGRDIASVNIAVQTLMTDVMTRLRKIKPDVMIEFRQPYTGPVMRTYGNMLRAIDCPNNAVANRVQIADLRLISGNTAVHSDMLMWHRDEPVEQAASQILATLYSVPQISVLLTKYPEKHLALVTHWTSYWKENRDVLLDGTFTAHQPVANYPVLEATKDGKTIITVYTPCPVTLPSDSKEIHIINATGSDSITVIAPKDLGSFKTVTLDTMGKVTKKTSTQLNKGAHLLSIPTSGLTKLTK